MGHIKRKDKIGIIDTDDSEETHLCPSPNCNGVLGPKVTPIGQKRQRGDELFMSCTKCYRTYPKHESKVEPKFSDIMDTYDSPYDTDSGIMGLENKESGMTQTQRDRQKKLDEISKVEDNDIRRELLKGNTVNIIYDDTEQIRAAAGSKDSSNSRKLRSELREIKNLDVVDEIADY